MKIALILCEIDKLFDDYPAGVFSIFESNPPLGLASVGMIGANRGHEVKIIDQQSLRCPNDELVKMIIEFNPDVAGFSCSSLNIQNSLYCSTKLKQSLNCILFAGGIHVTMRVKEVNDYGIFDFLISGEGEEVFNKALQQIETYGKLVKFDIAGLYMKGDVNDKGVAILSSLDLPVIDRKILEGGKYKNKGALLKKTPCYSLFSSRGCPFKCRFCSKPDYFKLYRQREVEKDIEEIKILINEWGAKAVSFREDNFTVDLKRLELFCGRMIDEFEGNFYWECESLANLSHKTLEMMHRSGCRGIWCGVETIVSRWQKWINKELNKETITNFFYDCKEIGIKTGALFMFGFPHQTEEEINTDVEFALKLPTEFSAFQCMAIFPGSPLTDYYYKQSNLKFHVTDDVALALTEGKTFKEMIDIERRINQRILSSRLSYGD